VGGLFVLGGEFVEDDVALTYASEGATTEVDGVLECVGNDDLVSVGSNASEKSFAIRRSFVPEVVSIGREFDDGTEERP
jgi:hypothetical protein